MESPARTRETTPLDETWGRVDGYLRSRLRPDLYDRWFAPLRASAIDDGRLHVAAPDKFHRDFVDDNYRPWFEEFLPGGDRHAAAGGLRGRRPAARRGGHEAPAAPGQPAGRRAAGAPAPARATSSRPSWSASRTASPSRPPRRWPQKPGHAWNPLFLHGDSGLGKTHLLHAVGNAILAASPGGRVAVVSSERYTNDFVDALRKGTLDEFRKKYRECAALLDRRRAVLRRQGQDRRGVLPHLQHPLRAERPDRPLQRPQPQGAQGAGGAALLPLRVGHAGPDRRPGVRDPRRHPEAEGRARADRPAGRGDPRCWPPTSAPTSASCTAP